MPKILKEMERVTSEKPELILQELHSQVIVHNLAAMIKKESDKIITHTEKYKYQFVRTYESSLSGNSPGSSSY